jgi:hypothetical protein
MPLGSYFKSRAEFAKRAKSVKEEKRRTFLLGVLASAASLAQFRNETIASRRGAAVEARLIASVPPW